MTDAQWADAIGAMLAPFHSQLPPDAIARIKAHGAPIIRLFCERMKEKAPRNPGLTVPLDDDQKAKLQTFYSRYDEAAIQCIFLAVLEVEMPALRAPGGRH